MILIRNGEPAEDRFIRISGDEPIPEDRPVLVPAARFLADARELTQRSAAIGVIWPNDRRAGELAPYLDRLSLIALNFPTFRDGRAYSQARQLREQHGFRGELRATGDVLRDQFLFMLRTGFDSLEVRKDADVPAFAEAVRRYSIFYQPTGDRRASAAEQRLMTKSGRAERETAFLLASRFGERLRASSPDRYRRTVHLP